MIIFRLLRTKKIRFKKHLLFVVVIFLFFIALYKPTLSPLFRTKAVEWFPPSPQPPFDGAFKKIDDKLFVYSAFYDDSEPENAYIRILALDITTREWKPPLNCHFYDENFKFLRKVASRKVITADVNSIRNKSFSALTFFLCEIPQSIPGRSPTPETFVQLQKQDSRKNDKAEKDLLLKIHYHPSKGPRPPFLYKVAMCIQPLNFPVDKVPLFLLEWIEYYLLLGVDHITFYNFNVSQEILFLLDTYRKGGTVRVLDWPFPPRITFYRPSAQWVAATDCAHRYRGVAKYVIAVDTDEFLVPSKKHDNFPKYFDELWKDQDISYIQFTSKFWFKNFPRGPCSRDLGGQRLNNITNNLFIPTATTFLWGRQKKFVMRPDLVVESGTHFPSVVIKKSAKTVIWQQEVEKEGQGFYLHFRDCSPFFQRVNPVLADNSTCLETRGSFQDVQAAKRFGKLLIQRVFAKINGSAVFKKMFF